MKGKNIRKLTIAGVLVAVAVVGSLFSVPVLGAKCSPVQHMVNVLGAVLLGPGYAVGMAFAAALIRNLLGLGSLLAFPGSMIGALPCVLPDRRCPHGQHQGGALHLRTELSGFDRCRRSYLGTRAVRAPAHARSGQP